MQKILAVLILGLFAVSDLLAQSTNAISTLADLRARLSEAVNHPRFDAALWGVKIVSLDDKKTVFEHNA